MKARFTACATGWPEPEVEWFLNGDRIYPNERTQVEVEPNGKWKFVKKMTNWNLKMILSLDRSAGLLRLTIINCTPADVGKYLCRIFNPHGEDSCDAELLYDSKCLRTQLSTILGHRNN